MDNDSEGDNDEQDPSNNTVIFFLSKNPKVQVTLVTFTNTSFAEPNFSGFFLQRLVRRGTKPAGGGDDGVEVVGRRRGREGDDEVGREEVDEGGVGEGDNLRRDDGGGEEG